MENSMIVLLSCVVGLAFLFVSFASDPQTLQDFCVADLTSQVNINGFACKGMKDVTVDDFSYSGIDKAGNTSNPSGTKVTPVFASQLPGLNTLGISMARVDYAPGGVNPPHLHPRASEIIVVLQGTLEVGFITSFPEFKLFTKVLNVGDVFVYPVGLVHFQRNVGSGNAVVLGALSSQNPGVVPVAAALFGSAPSISDEVLTKAFQINRNTLATIKEKF